MSVDYYGTGDYKRADRVYPYTNTPSIEWQEANGNTASPRYYIADNSIFLLPKPYKAVTSGMNIRVIQNLVDITTATTEANIFNGRIFRSHHFIIAL